MIMHTASRPNQLICCFISQSMVCYSTNTLSKVIMPSKVLKETLSRYAQKNYQRSAYKVINIEKQMTGGEDNRNICYC